MIARHVSCFDHEVFDLRDKYVRKGYELEYLYERGDNRLCFVAINRSPTFWQRLRHWAGL